jgi:hypothetical protein
VETPDKMGQSKVFLEGNAALLTEYWQEKCGKKDVKIVLFGD